MKENLPFKSGQPLRPEEQEKWGLEDALASFEKSFDEDRAKKNRKAFLEKVRRAESTQAMYNEMSPDEQREYDERNKNR